MWGKTWAPFQLLSKDNEVLVLTEKVDPFSYEERLREQGMFILKKRLQGDLIEAFQYFKYFSTYQRNF